MGEGAAMGKWNEVVSQQGQGRNPLFARYSLRNEQEMDAGGGVHRSHVEVPAGHS